MAVFSDDYKAGLTESGGVVQDVHTAMVVRVKPEHVRWFEQARWRNVPDSTPVTHPAPEDKAPAKTGK